MSTRLKMLVIRPDGATAIQYGPIPGLIAEMTIAGRTSLEATLNTRDNSIATDPSSAGEGRRTPISTASRIWSFSRIAGLCLDRARVAGLQADRLQKDISPSPTPDRIGTPSIWEFANLFTWSI
jgi:Flp pilus assembly pilin Flp